MPRTGRLFALLVLTDGEHSSLVRWSRRAKSSQVLAMRAKIILACGERAANTDVATAPGIHLSTVGKWRRGFLVERVDGLIDEERPGRPPSIALDRVEEVVVATLEQTPRNAIHWSRTSTADRSGLSKSTMVRIWRVFGLQPHQADTCKLSTDPQVIDKVVEVIGLYHNPQERAVALCVTETSQTKPWTGPDGATDDAGSVRAPHPRPRP